MNIYLITQTENTDYDTYNSAVVIAKDEKSAKNIHPDGNVLKNSESNEGYWRVNAWTTPENVTVQLVGVANKLHKENTVVCASFNAG